MIVTTSQTAWVTAWALWNRFFTNYRFPTSILSNQNHHFKSSLIKELCDLGGICKVCTTLYHLQGNGQCKQFNSTLINMIGSLQEEDKSHWRDFVPTLAHDFNCTESNATGFSPYYLMFGHKMKLCLNLQFGLQTEEQLHRAHHNYVN